MKNIACFGTINVLPKVEYVICGWLSDDQKALSKLGFSSSDISLFRRPRDMVPFRLILVKNKVSKLNVLCKAKNEKESMEYIIDILSENF